MSETLSTLTALTRRTTSRLRGSRTVARPGPRAAAAALGGPERPACTPAPGGPAAPGGLPLCAPAGWVGPFGRPGAPLGAPPRPPRGGPPALVGAAPGTSQGGK